MPTVVLDEHAPNVAAELAGITYRQLTYWVRSGYLTPSGPSPRQGWSTYTAADVEKLKVLRRCSDVGWQPQLLTGLLGDLVVGPGDGYVVVTRGWGDDSLRVTWCGNDELRGFLDECAGPHVVTPTRLATTAEIAGTTATRGSGAAGSRRSA
jgi:MerR HTH family regulatory protein